MGVHDAYGKQVMRAAGGDAYADCGDGVCVPYLPGKPARVDGTVGADIAVEIESRVFNQIRGAVLDLLCHHYPKKLLVLVPAHMSNADVAASQRREIMSRLLPAASESRVVVLEGTGYHPAMDADVSRVRKVLEEFGQSSPAVPANDARAARAPRRAGQRLTQPPTIAKVGSTSRQK